MFKLVPLNKGGNRGLCFSGIIPRFHEDKFTTPFAPFSKGDFCIACIM